MKSISTLSVRPARVLAVLGTGILILVCLGMLGQYSTFFLNHERLLGFVPEFDLSKENNLPTYFSALLLLVASMLIGLIARFVRPSGVGFHRHWVALAVIFAYLSVDEIASLHERLGEPVQLLVEPGGMFTYAWVIPGMILLCLFVAAYIRFFLHLPSRWKVLFGLSGAVYVLGALGVEMLGAWYASQYGVTFVLSVMVAVEESLEMAGSALFIYALLDYIRAHVSGVLLSFDAVKETRPSVASRTAPAPNVRAAERP